MTNQKNPDNSIFRILDAAINRAAEGLRVVEDYLRMVISDAHLSATVKQLRHDLTTATAAIDPQQRLAARDSIGDVGRTTQTESEYQRGGESGSHSIVQPNLARAQQALRTIEEFSKTIDSNMAKEVEQLRYRTYTVEKAILTTVVSLKNLADARLYVLLDGQSNPATDKFSCEPLQSLVRKLIDGKVDIIQLRDKRLSDRQLVQAGRCIASLTRKTTTRFIMNDRTDLAMATGADGVHLGQDELQVADARRIVGANRLIGVSTHNIQQARQAVLDGANYIGVGPVFPSATKSFDSHVGLELVQEVANEIQLPAFAIGGINLDNAASVCQAGQIRIAVSHAIVGTSDPEKAAMEFRELLF